MEIEIKNKAPYWVSFHYSTNERGGRVTTCVVNQDRVEICKASVTCSKSDTFKKEQGRKRSITKCLDILQLNREERTEFWNQYHNRVPVSTIIETDVQEYLDVLSFMFFEGRETAGWKEEATEAAFLDALEEIGIELTTTN